MGLYSDGFKWEDGLILFVLAAVAIGLLVLYLKSPDTKPDEVILPVEVLKEESASFVADVANGRMSEAYARTTDAYRSDNTFERFTEMASAAVESWDGGSFSYESHKLLGEELVFSGTITIEAGTHPAALTYTKNPNGVWAVSGFTVDGRDAIP